jgi:hypothetical protein
MLSPLFLPLNDASCSELLVIFGSVQVLGFLIEVLGSKFERHIQGVLEATIEILKQSNSYELEEDEDNVVFWQEAYFALTMVEKLLLQFPRLYFEQELQVPVSSGVMFTKCCHICGLILWLFTADFCLVNLIISCLCRSCGN